MTERRPKATTKTERIVNLKADNPTLSERQLAKLTDSSKTNVHAALHRYGLIQSDIDDYVEHRATILQGLQAKILKSIDLPAIQKTPASQRVVMAGILYDKERLERGQSTDIVDHRVITAKLSEVTDRLKSINADFTISHDGGNAGSDTT
jgi:hypothetical protein